MNGLTVTTYNVRFGTAEDGPDSWDCRKGLFLDSIDDLKPSLMGVQESLCFQDDEIKRRCPRLDRFGLARYHGKACGREHDNYGGERCTLFFDSDQMSLMDWGTFWHSDTPDVPVSRSWGNDLPRITTWGIFTLPVYGEIAVFNSHYHWRASDEYLQKTDRLLVERIKSIAEERPIIVMGDFNMEPGSRTYKTLCDKLKLRDVWIEGACSSEEEGTFHGFSGKGEARIDWILVSHYFFVSSVNLYRKNRYGSYPSDHFPVTAELKLHLGS